MNRLSTLGALIAGAIILAAIYGSAFGDRSASAQIDIDDGEGYRQIINGDRGSFSLRREDLVIKATWRGEYELNATGDDIASLDHKLEITREDDGVAERVSYEPDGGDVAREYFRDGEKQDDSPEAQAAAKALLAAYLEASGSKAKERVAIMLREGGPASVIAKISTISGDHARLRYVTELTEQADLNAEEMQGLLTAIKGFEGDHDLRVALDSVLEHETVDPAQMPLFLEAAMRIESDYDVRRLIESVSEKPLTDDALTLAIELMQNLESDHDLRRAGEALLEQKNLSSENAVRLLDTIGDRIESDHDLRLLLSDAADFLARGEALAAAWIRAYGALESDHDRRVALEEAADIDGVDADVIAALISASDNIGSDHDRRLALEAYADRAGQDPALRNAYEAAARGIGSDSDRKRALAAIGLKD